jgi:hypothetical protein
MLNVFNRIRGVEYGLSLLKTIIVQTQHTKLERIMRCDVIYFRVAIRMDQSSQWRWKSSLLNTPGTLFDFLNMYDRVPKNRLRVFFATSLEFINEMLVRENSGLFSNSITVEGFLKSGRRIDRQHIMQLEFEIGLQENRALIARSVITRKLGDECPSLQVASSIEPSNPVIAETRGNNLESNFMILTREKLEWSRGDGYDTLYTFALPVSMPQALAWTTLLAKVQRGELIP